MPGDLGVVSGIGGTWEGEGSSAEMQFHKLYSPKFPFSPKELFCVVWGLDITLREIHAPWKLASLHQEGGLTV